MNLSFEPWARRHSSAICSAVMLSFVLAAELTCLAQQQNLPEAPGASLEGRTVSNVQVLGTQRLSASTIRAAIHTQPGQPYHSATINQDLKAVQRLRGVDAVYVSAKVTPEQLVVIFEIAEQQVVRSVDIQGHRRFTTAELSKLLRISPGDFADNYLLVRGREALADHYRKSGYHRVQVTVQTDMLASQGKVVYVIVEGPRTRVSKITFQGNRRVSSRKLRSQVKSKAHALFFSAGNLDLQQLDSDLTRASFYLQDQGYLDAQVGKRLDFSSDQKWVKITFLVSEGPLYKVREVHFVGNKNLPSKELTPALKVKAGDVPARTAFTSTNIQRLLEAYGRKGYVDAQANVTTNYIKDQPGVVDLVYNIEEGSQYRVGRIDILGNEVTQDRVIRRQLLVAPNDIYNTEKMQRSRDRLLESTLFSQVDISDVIAAPSVRDVKIQVIERPTAMLLMGVGVTSDAGVVGDFSFTQRNFDLFNFPTFRGAGQTLRLQAQPGSELTRFSIDFREPYVADLPISFDQSLYLRSRLRQDYDEDRLGALWSLGLRFAEDWEIEGAIRLEKVTIRDIDDDTAAEIIAADGDHNLTSVQATLVRDRTDNVFLPSNGDIFQVSYQQIGAIGGDYAFGRLEASYTCYFTTHVDSLDRKSILALRGRVGTIFGDAPFFERYYAGGIDTIRGFDFRGVSPRVPSVISGDDIPIGSDWLVLAGAEYSFPLVGENFRGAAFVDTAAVDEGPYRVAAGFSLRLMVPYFAPVPLSADFAWPLIKDNNDDTRVFSFSFAVPFR